MTDEPGAGGGDRNLPAATTHQMSRLLRTGLAFAAAIALVGALRVLIEGGALSLNVFDPVANRMAFDLSSIGRYFLEGNGVGIAALGLLVLVATPVARVAFGIYGFWRAKDPVLARIATVVLLLLLVGLFALGPLLR
ncbi:MAG: DUF1634 domain-containing protein [Thermoplasmata archaeon]|nr:DUF1634 domain-containing protein [Thermoplasmata archaeon]